ncbi:MAG: 16S rRNA (cytosine(1402)-N(4))-methyltransferase RsmH [Chloroflexi bacterium]|nr:16S rRNA (cytosine(1402)-N(4))-methyltransferase RsmH [Chloroflexota bacterium]
MPPGEHASVLRDEVLAWLRPRPTGRYVDATLGNAGHAIALLEAAPDTTVLGLDADPAALDVARARLGRLAERATLVHANFRDLASVARASGFADVDGIVMDLGLSSRQLDVAGRGFSFRRDEPLDMRLDPTHGESAAELLRHADEADIADILYQYGEEHRSRRVARAIVQRRERSPIETTQDLVQAVEAALGPKRGRIHPATRTFQALRIAVNGELAALDAVLPQAAALLGARGRLAVISFHSLEDRRVKWFFRNGGPEQAPLSELTRKPVVPSEAELQANPRARSAKLRIAERIDPAVERPESHPDWWARRRRDRGPS